MKKANSEAKADLDGGWYDVGQSLHCSSHSSLDKAGHSAT